MSIVLLYVRLRDGRERFRRVSVEPKLIDYLKQKLTDNVDIREWSLAVETARHHKSYAEDFTPPADGTPLIDFLRTRSDPPLVDPSNAWIVEADL